MFPSIESQNKRLHKLVKDYKTRKNIFPSIESQNKRLHELVKEYKKMLEIEENDRTPWFELSIDTIRQECGKILSEKEEELFKEFKAIEHYSLVSALTDTDLNYETVSLAEALANELCDNRDINLKTYTAIMKNIKKYDEEKYDEEKYEKRKKQRMMI